MIPPTAMEEKRTIGQENLLLDYVQKLERHKSGRRAAVVRLSALLPQHRRDHHVRIAANTFEALVKQFRGQIFTLSNGDLVFIFKEEALEETEAAIVKLRFLFSDDPLLVEENQAGKPSFVNWFMLSRDYDSLLHLAQSAVTEEQNRRNREFTKSYVARQTATLTQQGEPLTPHLLHRLEETLSRADPSNMMRRQAISAIIGKAPPQPVFNELFISIADLRETVLPNVNLASNPWLFQQLTETLDRRVLSLLNKHDDRTVAGDVSININVQTLLSPEFLAFDDNLRAGMRGTIVLEVQKVDIFADLGAFLFARDFAHDRGYRLCIDGVTMESLPFIDRDRLGVDLLKLAWTPELAGGTLPNGESLEVYLRRCGPSRAILCRCDAQDAIDFGQSVGITLFQGRHVEALRAAEAQRSKGISGRRRLFTR